VLWTDDMIEPDTLIKMHFFQKISHFPGIYVIARKNLLGLSLTEMKKKFPEDYNFFPKTWLLPTDFSDFRQEVENCEANNQNKCYIVKPEAECQGRGIFLTFRTD
jgi:tubulin polyglutamylase TTLL6/13